MNLNPLRTTLLLALGLSGCAPVLATIDTDPQPPITPVCPGDTPIIGPDGAPTGFSRCADGAVHRVSARAGVLTTTAQETCREGGACTADDQCTDGLYGRCLEQELFWDTGGPSCGCEYSCATDAECGAGQICLPPGVWAEGKDRGQCIQAACATDAACPSGECGLTTYNDGCGWQVNLTCRDKAVDDCHSDGDCDQGMYCASNYGTGPYTCRGYECGIGRPLTVEQGQRTAPAVLRGDWMAPLQGLDITGLTAAQRDQLVEHWLAVAALEHASVASFSRHTLELMWLGAPPDLLADAQAAALDEIRHARLAFGVASVLSGAPVGPGSLDLTDVTPRQGVHDVLAALLVEGCIGETLGAAEAQDAAHRATDPVLRGVLQHIADDETRHAALAWRTVQWMLAQDPALASVVHAALDAAPLPASDGEAGDLAGWGLPAPDYLRALHARVWGEVITPLAEGLSTPAAHDATHVWS